MQPSAGSDLRLDPDAKVCQSPLLHLLFIVNFKNPIYRVKLNCDATSSSFGVDGPEYNLASQRSFKIVATFKYFAETMECT